MELATPSGRLEHHEMSPEKTGRIIVVDRKKLLTPIMEEIDPDVWSQEWVVDSQSVGGGENSLRYLARYVFRVAISNNRIVSFDQRSVTFRYKDSETRTWQPRTLEGLEFIRRFLQHVLPTGFMKVRHFGFLNGNAAIPLTIVYEMICALFDLIYLIPPVTTLSSRNIRDVPAVRGGSA